MENIEQINLFNKIRIDYYINDNFNSIHLLSREEYILFHNWRQQLTVTELLSKEYILKPIPLHSKKLIFHGECIDCNSQDIYGVDRCLKCIFFGYNNSYNEDLKVI
jgi:hypothetical protein